MADSELTFILIKPDGLQRGLIGEIITRFEKKGFFLKAMKMLQLSQAFAEKHYAELAHETYFPALIKYVTSSPVVAMIWEGEGAAATCHNIIGFYDPAGCEAGTLRGDHSIDVNRNLIDGSRDVASAKRAISLWFPEGIVDWKSAMHAWIYST